MLPSLWASTEAGPSRLRSCPAQPAKQRGSSSSFMQPRRAMATSLVHHAAQSPRDNRRIIDRSGRDVYAARSAASDGQHVKGGVNKTLWQSYTSLAPSTRIKLAAGLAAFALVGLYVSDQVEPYLPTDEDAQHRPTRQPEPQPSARPQAAEMNY